MRCASHLFITSLVCVSFFLVEPAPTSLAQGAGSLAQSPATRDAAAAAAGHYAAVHGLKMYYEIHGQGESLLLLHGGLGSIPVWPEALEHFSRSYRVIAPEQMGHGRTADDPSRLMDYHAMAEDTVELLRQLDIKEVYVLGWSDGGILGFDLAINHPSLVKKLAVSGASFSPNDPPGPLDAPDTIPSFIREPYERLSPDGASHWPVLLRRLRTMWLTQPNISPDQFLKIRAPTLVIAGDQDFYTPEYTVRMWRAIPHAQLWIAPNSTHGLPKKRAALFNAVVSEFFKEPVH